MCQWEKEHTVIFTKKKKKLIEEGTVLRKLKIKNAKLEIVDNFADAKLPII